MTAHTDLSGVPRTAHINLGDATEKAKVEMDRAIFENVQWQKGDGRLEAWIMDGKQRYGVKYIEVERLGD